ncbi:MAG: hypothetical protein HQL18_04640, partial [Candidatus Omnitrophica bacterium]|nr:hypothetical protein [Candidatus Omnitrophota bacterium]
QPDKAISCYAYRSYRGEKWCLEDELGVAAATQLARVLIRLWRQGNHNFQHEFPMIETEQDWDKVGEILKAAWLQETPDADPNSFSIKGIFNGKEDGLFFVGSMIETPGAVQLLERLLEKGCRFFSYGTNDLTALTLNKLRADPENKKYFTRIEPTILRHILRSVGLEVQKMAWDLEDQGDMTSPLKTIICGNIAGLPEFWLVDDHYRRHSVVCEDALPVYHSLVSWKHTVMLSMSPTMVQEYLAWRSWLEENDGVRAAMDGLMAKFVPEDKTEWSEEEIVDFNTQLGRLVKVVMRGIAGERELETEYSEISGGEEIKPVSKENPAATELKALMVMDGLEREVEVKHKIHMTPGSIMSDLGKIAAGIDPTYLKAGVARYSVGSLDMAHLRSLFFGSRPGCGTPWNGLTTEEWGRAVTAIRAKVSESMGKELLAKLAAKEACERECVAALNRLVQTGGLAAIIKTIPEPTEKAVNAQLKLVGGPAPTASTSKASTYGFERANRFVLDAALPGIAKINGIDIRLQYGEVPCPLLPGTPDGVMNFLKDSSEAAVGKKEPCKLRIIISKLPQREGDQDMSWSAEQETFWQARARALLDLATVLIYDRRVFELVNIFLDDDERSLQARALSAAYLSCAMDPLGAGRAGPETRGSFSKLFSDVVTGLNTGRWPSAVPADGKSGVAHAIASGAMRKAAEENPAVRAQFLKLAQDLEKEEGVLRAVVTAPVQVVTDQHGEMIDISRVVVYRLTSGKVVWNRFSEELRARVNIHEAYPTEKDATAGQAYAFALHAKDRAVQKDARRRLSAEELPQEWYRRAGVIIEGTAKDSDDTLETLGSPRQVPARLFEVLDALKDPAQRILMARIIRCAAIRSCDKLVGAGLQRAAALAETPEEQDVLSSTAEILPEVLGPMNYFLARKHSETEDPVRLAQEAFEPFLQEYLSTADHSRFIILLGRLPDAVEIVPQLFDRLWNLACRDVSADADRIERLTVLLCRAAIMARIIPKKTDGYKFPRSFISGLVRRLPCPCAQETCSLVAYVLGVLFAEQGEYFGSDPENLSVVLARACAANNMQERSLFLRAAYHLFEGASCLRLLPDERQRVLGMSLPLATSRGDEFEVAVFCKTILEQDALRSGAVQPALEDRAAAPSARPRPGKAQPDQETVEAALRQMATQRLTIGPVSKSVVARAATELRSQGEDAAAALLERRFAANQVLAPPACELQNGP